MRGRGRMKAIVRTAAGGRWRLGNAQVASPTLAAQSAPLLARQSTCERDRASQRKAAVAGSHIRSVLRRRSPAPQAAQMHFRATSATRIWWPRLSDSSRDSAAGETAAKSRMEQSVGVGGALLQLLLLDTGPRAAR